MRLIRIPSLLSRRDDPFEALRSGRDARFHFADWFEAKEVEPGVPRLEHVSVVPKGACFASRWEIAFCGTSRELRGMWRGRRDERSPVFTRRIDAIPREDATALTIE